MTFQDLVRDRLSVTEGVRNFIYLDTKEIPTTSRGLALLTSNWGFVKNLDSILSNMGFSEQQIVSVKSELARFNTDERSIAQKNFFKYESQNSYVRGDIAGNNYERITVGAVDRSAVQIIGTPSVSVLGYVASEQQELSTINSFIDSQASEINSLFVKRGAPSGQDTLIQLYQRDANFSVAVFETYHYAKTLLGSKTSQLVLDYVATGNADARAKVGYEWLFQSNRNADPKQQARMENIAAFGGAFGSDLRNPLIFVIPDIAPNLALTYNGQG